VGGLPFDRAIKLTNPEPDNGCANLAKAHADNLEVNAQQTISHIKTFGASTHEAISMAVFIQSDEPVLAADSRAPISC
jgi:hypothetical protein